MSWRAYIADTITGQLIAPIDIPSFAWSISVSDSTLSTTKDKGAGEYDASGLTLPWTSVPGSTPAERVAMLAQDKRSIVLFWKTSLDPQDLGTPILMGSISPRTDSWQDTSFTLNSVMELLDSRILVRENTYGRAANSTTSDEFTLHGSWRGIAAQVGYMCTDMKPGGRLPIDWNNRGESGNHSMDFKGFDAGNQSCRQILESIANTENGIDMQFRPYLAGNTVRFSFQAASDGDVHLGQSTVHRLYCRRYGGDLENVTIDHIGPVMRVYAAGAGSDKAQLGYLAEDLSLCLQSDPWPLREMTLSNTDTDKAEQLAASARENLNANRLPLMQIKGEVNVNDHDSTRLPVNPLGSFWPGERMEIALDGFPGMNDGIYQTRLMQMSGDETAQVKLTFDVMTDPIR